MRIRFFRLLVFSVFWFALLGIGTLYYSDNIHGAMYWKTGGWGIVLLGPLFYFTDQKLQTRSWYANRPLITLASAIVVSYVLYVPLIVLFFLALTILDG